MLIVGSKIHEKLRKNLLNPPWKYSKHQTRAEKIQKCLDEGIEATYYFSVFRITWKKIGIIYEVPIQLSLFLPIIMENEFVNH